VILYQFNIHNCFTPNCYFLQGDS